MTLLTPSMRDRRPAITCQDIATMGHWLIRSLQDQSAREISAELIAVAPTLQKKRFIYALLTIILQQRYHAQEVDELSAQCAQYFSIRNRRLTAYHEAGHLLAYLALTPLPEGIEVTLHRRRHSIYENYNGSVTAAWTDIHLTEQTRLEWVMLTAMAGTVAEEMIGQPAVGNRHDMALWQQVANRYVREGYHFVRRTTCRDNPFTMPAPRQITQHFRLYVATQEVVACYLRVNADVLNVLAAQVANGLPLQRRGLLQLKAFVHDPQWIIPASRTMPVNTH